MAVPVGHYVAVALAEEPVDIVSGEVLLDRKEAWSDKDLVAVVVEVLKFVSVFVAEVDCDIEQGLEAVVGCIGGCSFAERDIGHTVSLAY